MSCETSLGHEGCNYQFITVEREGHIADRESWKRSSKQTYKRKVAKQQRLK